MMVERSLGYPKTWITYAVCLISSLLIAIDTAGWAALTGVPAFFMVIGVTFVNVIRLRGFVKRYQWKGIFPILVCAATLPFAGMLGQKMLEWRFLASQERYEALSQKIYSGAYSLPLSPADSALALRAEKVELNNEVVAVGFMVMSHGYAGGHAQYMRVFNDKYEHAVRSGGELQYYWGSRSSLGGRWYLLQE